MADLISSWSNKRGTLPPTYVLPMHERPVDPVPIVKEIPVIDLGKAKGDERAVVIQQLLKACEDYGFFQVINHGIPENLMDEAMEVYQEFFSLPVEEKANYAKEAANAARGAATLYSSSARHYETEEHKYWRDVLEHTCNVDGEDKSIWPDKPPRYREVIGLYSTEVRKLSKIILGLVSEGLGLEAGYFDKDLGQRMLSNLYPECPDPSLTLGVGGHCDPNLITIIQQDAYGLQILKDEKWIGIEPLPHALVVNSGLALTVISNGKLGSVAHRVVTNTTQARTSICTFICPEEVVEPAKSLVSPSNPPLYKSFKWRTEFMPHYLSKKSVYYAALEPFKVDA
ncbi:hyoscyamine 6-dioxygenase-like [Nicotiana tabacum]|uniref:Hyoscyamine 6-dioxygenase-like n=2 Tax=Nicotiana TaxID=4085 RepID=A0A1S4DCL9_TOBAC|nr:PREDICTED: hyoscyamine 6-dioxygenase-like [Nicotiana sylvestris]XP_009777933.1 PREDICTED: hyoscyamine 6-dioxygenase-like [Nicotiana sylvestris]XP_016511151.1 PREDICTED: hyoscyamine 6-dioxygenase-like [Nicotiana tabacum]